MTFVANRLLPFLERQIDLVPIYRFRLSRGRFPDDHTPGPVAITHSQQLANLMARRSQYSEIALGSFGRAASQVDRILTLLEASEQ